MLTICLLVRFCPMLVAPAAELPTLRYDPVELVAGREVLGEPELAVTHGAYAYLFATDENRQRFQKDAARYEIQLGGACARMGPLSGEGSPDRFAVHDGRIYIFASDACRKTFLSAPEKLLERDDPRPAPPADAVRRGRELLEKAVTALGGAARLDALKSYREELVEELRQKDDSKLRHVETTTFRFPDDVRYEDTWGDYRGGHVGTEPDAFFFSRETTRAMEASQRAALWRLYAHHPVWILRARQRPDFVCVAAGPGSLGDAQVEQVTVWFDGAATTLGVDPDTGRIVAARYVGRGPKLTLGTVEKVYADFRDVGGLTLPFRATTTRFADEPVTDGRREFTTVEVDIDLAPALFSRRQ